MKNNKRMHLSKPLKPTQEAMMEIKKHEALKIYDECMKLLEEGEELKDKNLTKTRIGLKNLHKKVKDGFLIIAQTDKSGRFAIFTREEYIRAGEKQTDKDKEVSLGYAEQNQQLLNGLMEWLSSVINLDNRGTSNSDAKQISSTMDWPSAQ